MRLITDKVVDGFSRQTGRVVDFVHAEDAVTILLGPRVWMAEAAGEEDEAGNWGSKAFVSRHVGDASYEVIPGGFPPRMNPLLRSTPRLVCPSSPMIRSSLEAYIQPGVGYTHLGHNIEAILEPNRTLVLWRKRILDAHDRNAQLSY